MRQQRQSAAVYPGRARQGVAAAAEVDQGTGDVAHVGGEHLADEDGVVARLGDRHEAALEVDEGILDEGRAQGAARGHPQATALHLVYVAAGVAATDGHRLGHVGGREGEDELARLPDELVGVAGMTHGYGEHRGRARHTHDPARGHHIHETVLPASDDEDDPLGPLGGNRFARGDLSHGPSSRPGEMGA